MDYRGNICVSLRNDSSVGQIVEVGERIAQLIIQPYIVGDLDEVDVLSKLGDTDRGMGGFGSTGTSKIGG